MKSSDTLCAGVHLNVNTVAVRSFSSNEIESEDTSKSIVSATGSASCSLGSHAQETNPIDKIMVAAAAVIILFFMCIIFIYLTYSLFAISRILWKRPFISIYYSLRDRPQGMIILNYVSRFRIIFSCAFNQLPCTDESKPSAFFAI